MVGTTLRRRGEFLRGAFTILRDSPEGMPAHDVLQQLENTLPPTDFESTDYPDKPGVRRYEKIIRFSTIGAVKAGWLVKSKGTWTVTQDGLAAMDAYADPEALYRESDRLYWVWKKSQTAEGESEQPEQPHPSVTLEEAEETARQEIFDYLAKMPPYDLQELVAALLRAMGYHVAWVAPPGPDRGIDILAYTDPLGAAGPRIKVQVKRRADKIAVQEVRSFFAVLGPTDVGIFVSIGGFSSDAHSEARHQETRRVALFGVDELVDLWVEHYSEVPEEARHLLPLRPIYYLASD